MAYPVGKNKQDYIDNWYIASGFGEVRSSTYIHEGIDLNLKTGGDTDLGQPIYAISDYTLRYYHLAKHLNSTAYGVHIVYEINTPSGLRWIQCMHVQENPPIMNNQIGRAGDVIAYVGKTGTTVSHLHFAVYKENPSTFGGIDVVVGDTPTLNLWWEDPIPFLEKLNTGVSADCLVPNTPEWQAKYNELVTKATRYDEFKSEGYESMANIREKIAEVQKNIDSLNNTVGSLNQLIGEKNSTISKQLTQIGSLETQINDMTMRISSLEEQAKKIPQLEEDNKYLLEQKDKWIETEKTYNRTMAQLRSDNEKLRQQSVKILLSVIGDHIVQKLKDFVDYIKGFKPKGGVK